jgi:hypothetical protein
MFLSSCGNSPSHKNNTPIIDDYQPAKTSEQLREMFLFALNNNRLDSLYKLFLYWNKSIRSNSTEYQEQNDTVNAVYRVYAEFYNPLNKKIFNGGLLGYQQNSVFHYVVIQNQICYSIQENTNFLTDYRFKGKKNSIINFRPVTVIYKTKVLYLTNEYEDCFYKLLSPNRIIPKVLQESSPPELTDEIKMRLKKLKLFFPILQGHWGDYWHLETHPEVEIIVLNTSLDTAKVWYRFGYGGGETILLKKNNNWIVSKSVDNWIE